MANREEEEKQVEKAYEYYREVVIPSLPVKKGWWLNGDICQYRGFWFQPSKGLEGVMWLQDHFKPRPSDVFLTTSPKSGTTWLKALVFSVLNRNQYNNIETHPLLHKNPHECMPALLLPLKEPPITDPELLPSPRLLSSHIPYSVLPEAVKTLNNGCPIIYMSRNPKDVLISFWHFLSGAKGTLFVPNQDQLQLPTLEQMFDMFCEGACPFGPFWDHALEYWKASLERPDKVLFLKYEDMKKDGSTQLKRMGAFLGHPFTAQEESGGLLDEILRLCSFESLSNMEVNKKGSVYGISFASFFRKGQIGDWENHLTPDMADRIDHITREKFRDSGLIL